MPRPRNLPPELPSERGGDAEHAAWIAACDKLNELLRYAFGADTLPTVNGEVSNDFVDAIRYWGECLVDLRGHQTPQQRARALQEAAQLVAQGRPPRRA